MALLKSQPTSQLKSRANKGKSIALKSGLYTDDTVEYTKEGSLDWERRKLSLTSRAIEDRKIALSSLHTIDIRSSRRHPTPGILGGSHLLRSLTKQISIQVTSNEIKFTDSIENEYFLNVVKKDRKLRRKYMRKENESLNVEFHKRYGEFNYIVHIRTDLQQAKSNAVFARSDLNILVINVNRLEKALGGSREEIIKEKVYFFEDFFPDTSFNTLRRIWILCEEQTIKTGETIYQEGSPCDGIYFLKSGEVQV